MTISDDGTGFPAKTENKRHGIGLVRRLVEQVRGSAIVVSDHGTVWTVKIPAPLPLEQDRHDAARNGRDDRAAPVTAEIA